MDLKSIGREAVRVRVPPVAPLVSLLLSLSITPLSFNDTAKPKQETRYLKFVRAEGFGLGDTER